MVATMAAALAASLPAPQAEPLPPAPTYDAIPASMSKVIDTEAEIPLSCVQLDGLVRTKVFVTSYLEHRRSAQAVTRIVKHGREASSSNAHGLLLGLDLDGVLEVSNSFPLPNQIHEDDEKLSKSIGKPAVISEHVAI
jgi:translation initiation factor 3 subunit H